MAHLIKFELKKTGEAKIEIDGNAVDLMVGCLTLIKSIYHQAFMVDENDAKFIVDQIAEALTNPESPMYEEFYKELPHG